MNWNIDVNAKSVRCIETPMLMQDLCIKTSMLMIDLCIETSMLMIDLELKHLCQIVNVRYLY